MRFHQFVILMLEVALLLAMSAIGAYMLTGSSFDFGARETLAKLAPALAANTPIVVGGVLFLFGVLLCEIGGLRIGLYTWLIALLMTPALLSHNGIHWLAFFGDKVRLSTTIGLNGMMALGTALILCYFIFGHLASLRRERVSMADRGAGTQDIREVTLGKYLTLGLVSAGALLFTALVAFSYRQLGTMASGWIGRIPWNIVVIGLGCLFFIALLLHWLGERRRSEVRDEETNR